MVVKILESRLAASQMNGNMLHITTAWTVAGKKAHQIRYLESFMIFQTVAWLIGYHALQHSIFASLKLKLGLLIPLA